ncbi:bifunctional hydroxyacyl-CoA dehydrogenase/enoyl-CoA hydratase fox2 [Sporothrix eucalyptigena]|uniref:Bifunctional hydroxyacyl-CoA dehydrogenase/enoyl-CoA hydratase fox2 n=1 Tax=Sporothrix eucalyptigena TaxID=1812306 RepID=A0ABP0D246_9PEZI
MPVTVKDRVAIVTGAGGGLGFAYAMALAKAGAKVVVNDYGGDTTGANAGEDISRAQRAAEKIVAAGGVAVANTGDVTKDYEAIVATAIEAFGCVDILVNNAGVLGRMGKPDTVDAANFRRVVDITALGSAMMTRTVYPHMKARNWGRIVNVSSGSIFGLDFGSDCAYTASKGAAFGMTRELGRVAVRDGIKCNGVLPSGTSRLTALTPELHELTKQFMRPEQAAHFVVLLCSEECPVSGELFNITGVNASRVALATYPGTNQESAEGFLANWYAVMGNKEDAVFLNSTGELAGFLFSRASGSKFDTLENFGVHLD